MPKRRTIVLPLTAVALIVGVLLFATRSREPSYQGHSLSYWVAWHPPDERLLAQEAIEHIGSNAIPFLLEWIRYEQSPGKEKYLELVNKPLNWLRDNVPGNIDWRLNDHGIDLAAGAACAFAHVGPEASNAVPELVRLLNDSKWKPSKDRAAYALSTLGENGLPPVVAALTSTNAEVRRCGALNLRYEGTNALVAVPQLLGCLSDPDHFVATFAAGTLAEIKADPSVVIPILQAQLTNSTSSRQTDAASALEQYGSWATSAVPSLLWAMRGTNSTVSAAARSSLHAIAPEVLTNAPPPAFP